MPRLDWNGSVLRLVPFLSLRHPMRLSLTSFALLCTALAMPETAASAQPAKNLPEHFAYVGTYTTGESKGIYQFRVQEGPGGPAFVSVGLAAATPNPSFLAVDPKRRVLFAVNETSDFEGRPSGAVSAFSIEAATGRLTFLNQKATNGTDPCHLALDPAGRHLVVANYSSGSVAVFRVEADGHLGDMTSFVQHEGKSVHPQRQQGPHAHAINFDPTGRFVYVCDLGIDQVLAYRLDANTGKLTAAGSTPLAPGAGPRHLAFGRDGKFAYVVNELNSTVTAFATEPGSPKLRELQTISTLPAGFTGRSTCAEIHVHPSGAFLYASNRGHDSLAIFSVDPTRGTLQAMGHHSTGGKTPRHFDFTPAGTHVISESQDSNTMQVSAVDAKTGLLKVTGALIPTPVPICVVFVPVAAR